MIRKAVDFALNNRFLVLAAALLLFVWGAISFHQLPVEAYPDVANNYVEVITQWPGISAEQIEQQVTIPLEIVMNGIPHVTHLRSFSLFGLSDLKLIFDDDEENFWNRERVLERLSQVTLPPGVVPQMGTDWSPVGQIYFFTLHSTNPAYDVMELKSIEDWVVEKNLKSVPNIVDVASFGGPTREYQVRVDPNKLIAYGLSIGAGGAATHQQQRQCGRQLHRGRPAADQHPGSGPGAECSRYREHGHPDQERHAAAREGYRRRRARAEDPARPVRPRDPPRGRKARRQRRRGLGHRAAAERRGSGRRAAGDPRKSAGAERSHSAARREDRSRSSIAAIWCTTPPIPCCTTSPKASSWWSIILFLFLGNVRGAIIVALTIPFSLLFAATCLNLKGIPANLLSLGALDFGMVVDGAVVMVENIVRHLSRQRR